MDHEVAADIRIAAAGWRFDSDTLSTLPAMNCIADELAACAGHKVQNQGRRGVDG
jgi:hypothetical protein